jgi:hypothetical protein
MSLFRWLWLAQFKARLQSQKRPRRRPINLVSGLLDWELEERVLPSGGVPVPSNTKSAPGQVMWTGGNPINTTSGYSGISNPTLKTVTFQNPTDQTIYPFFRDANTGIAAGTGKGLTSGAYYDPQDFHNQEFRLYLGYVQGGQQFLGVPKHSSITVAVPLVFWNAENTYIATDGTNLLTPGSGYFTYSTTSDRYTSLDSKWVTNFSGGDSGATTGLVMFYHATTPSTPALSVPAQLTEFTIRDPYLANFKITDPDAITKPLIDYDVSYVDNAIAPITMEATTVPVPIPNNTNPPVPNYGWTGSDLTLTAMNGDIGGFVANSGSAFLGNYFSNPLSPLPPPGSAPGWPSYNIPPAGGGLAGTTAGGATGSTKVPGGQNIFLQSPLNGAVSGINNNFYMLTSGGDAAIQLSAGGYVAPSTQFPTQLSLSLNPSQRNALATQLQSMLQEAGGSLNLAVSSNPNATLGKVTGYISTGTILKFAITPGSAYTSNIKYKITGGGATASASGTGFFNPKGSITRATLPHTSTGGIPIYTSTPSIDISGGGGGSGAVLRPQISGEIQGMSIANGGSGYPATVKYQLKGGGQPTVTVSNAVIVNGSGKITQVNLPPGGGIYTSAPSLTLLNVGSGSGAQVYPDIGGGTVSVSMNKSGTGFTPGTLYTYNFSRPVSDYAATDITDLWYTWAQYYINQFSNFKGESLQGTLSNPGTKPDLKDSATLLTLSPGQTPSTPLAVGMTVSGNGIPTNSAPVTIIQVVPDSNGTKVYLSQLSGLAPGGSVSGTYQFGAPPALPYSDPTGLENITVTNPGANYLPPIEVDLTGGNGAGATAQVTKISGGSIAGIKVTSGGGNYTFAPTVTIKGGGGTNATATAVLNSTGQVSTINIGKGGGGYTFGPMVTIAGAGTGATAVANVIVPNGSTTGPISSIVITNAGTGYSPAVSFSGGGGAGAAAIVTGVDSTTGAITSIKITNPGSGYTSAPTVTITESGGSGATATAVFNPATGQVTGVTINQGGSKYSAGPTISITTDGSGSGATASATVGTFVTTYANLLPSPNTQLQGGTVLQFASTVYEALEAEASIPPAQSLRFYNPVLPPAVGLVGTTIGSDLGDLPNSNGGASGLGGQIRDLIKSVLRGVWNFEAVPESTQNWYPMPSKPTGALAFNPFNLDPYVWFIHRVLGMSGYGFSTDDDIANVGAGGIPGLPPQSPAAPLPNNLVVAFGGTNKLPEPQQWFPGVPWGNVYTSGQVSYTTSKKNPIVSLNPGGANALTKYWEVTPVTPGQSGGAYVIGPGIPAGTQVTTQYQAANLSFFLKLPSGQSLTPGGNVKLTFSGFPTGTPGPVAPAITLHPSSQSVAPGSNVSFSASASGTPSPTVQWQSSTDGGTTFTDISGATSTTLMLTNVTSAMNGYQYRAVFSNSAGNATSNAATLTVSAPVAPVITGNPSSQTVAAGSGVSFLASASGTPSPTVQWQSSTDGGTTFTDISGATSTTLTLNNVTISMNGYQYRAVFSNSAGNATTSAATLTVTAAPDAPVITLNPSSQSVAAGSNVSFLAAATGTPSPTVQWQDSTDGGTTFTDISGATSTTLTLNNVTTAMNGYQYQAVFSNTAGNATTSAATLTVTSAPPPSPVAPAITLQPSNQSVAPGSDVLFSASASGTPSPTVQWQDSVDGGTTFTDISGAISDTLTLNNVTTTMDGYQYRAVFSNSAGNATTNAAILTVTASPAAPVITESPNSQSVTAGFTVSFSASASGTPSPTVQWQDSTNGGTTFTDISGATSTTLMLNSVTTAMNGYQYRAVFSNSVGNATTSAATLTVNAPSPPSPAPTPSPTPAPPPAPTINDLFSLVQHEVFLTIDEVAALLAQTLGLPDNPTRSAAIIAHMNAISANPLASTPFGQAVLVATRVETLKLVMENQIPFGPATVL